MIMLQEIPAWAALAGYVYHNHVLLSHLGSDCGFLIPRHWMSAVKSEAYGAYWSACVLGNTIFVSAHVLEHIQENGRAQTVIQETVDYIHNVRQSYRSQSFELVLGCDATVTLPPEYDGITGRSVQPPVKSHEHRWPG